MTMGTDVAETYTTIVLGFLEETLYEHIKRSNGKECQNYVREQYKRYLDDFY